MKFSWSPVKSVNIFPSELESNLTDINVQSYKLYIVFPSNGLNGPAALRASGSSIWDESSMKLIKLWT